MVAGLVWRFTRLRALFALGWLQDGDPLVRELTDMAGRNADIESFGLHVRALRDFLYAGRDKPGDAIAADFFDDPLDWKRVRRKEPRALRPVSNRVGTEMAHLSYGRPSPSNSWDYESIWEAVSEVLRDFLDHAEPTRVGREVLKQIRTILDTPVHRPVPLTTVTASPGWSSDVRTYDLVDPSQGGRPCSRSQRISPISRAPGDS
jgi:hypothetical protein